MGHVNSVLSKRFYRPELDGLRSVAFLLVFLCHALQGGEDAPAADTWGSALVQAGRYGVDLFLVLSAFLITELLIREYEARGRVDVLAFYARRALRIWPLFFAYLTVHAVVPRILGYSFMDLGPLASFVFFAGNWTTAATGFRFPLANHLWTVCLEEQFYILWPLILGWLGRARWALAAAGAVAVAWAAREVAVLAELRAPFLWVSTPTRLDTIGLGALLACGLRVWDRRSRSLVAGAVTAFGLVTFVLVARYLPPNQSPPGHGASLGLGAVALAATGMVAAVTTAPRHSLLKQVLSSSALVAAGRVSYGAYVYHVGVIASAEWACRRLSLRIDPVLLVPAELAVTLVLSFASYRWLEAPFLRMKERWAVVPSRPV